MFAIDFKSEKGGALFASVFFLILLGMMGISLITMTLSDQKMNTVEGKERQAFYATQAGIEYGMRRIFEADPSSFSDWSETVQVGNGLSCEVSAQFLSGNRFRIQVSGSNSIASKRLEKEIEYIDVSDYAIYTSGTVTTTIASPWPPHSIFFIQHHPELVYQHATIMPIFDLDELRDMSKPNGYHDGDFTVSSVFNFPPNHLTFVEGNLTFAHWNWFGWGNFVTMGNVSIKSAWLPLSTTFGTVYQPVAGKTLISQKSFFRRSFIGGIITNGDIIGSSNGAHFPYWGKLTVFHHRNTIVNFMRLSLNGGPLLINRSRWTNLN